jgi:hypothetical protein
MIGGDTSFAMNGISAPTSAPSTTPNGAAEDMLLLADISGPTTGGGGLLDIIQINSSTTSSLPLQTNNNSVAKDNSSNLLDLLGDLDFSSTSVTPAVASVFPTGGTSSLLDGILASSSSSSSVQPPMGNSIVNNGMDDILGGLSTAAPTIATAPLSFPSSLPSVSVYNENSLSVALEFNAAPKDGRASLTLKAVNTSAESVTDFLFQSAVPKSMQVELQPPSGTVVEAGGGVVTQQVGVVNPGGEALRMRVRISYCNAAGPVQYQDDLSNFPANLAWR